MVADRAREVPNRIKLSSGWRRLGVAIIGAISVALIVWLAPPGKVLAEISDMNASWAGAAVALELASCLSYVIVFRYFFPELSRANSRRVAWIAMGAGAVLPGGNVSSAAATGLLLRRHGVGARELLGRCAALLCLLTAFGFAVNGTAGALLLAGVPDGPLDLSHAGIPVLVSVFVLSGAAMLVLANRRFGARTPRPVRGVAAGLEGAWAAVKNPNWRLAGAVGFLCLDMGALWAACAATGHRLGFLAVLIAYCIGYLATAVPMPAGLGVLDSGLAGALILYGLPVTASVGAVLVYHAISIWVPGMGGLVAWLSTRRAEPVERAPIAPAGLGTFRLAEAADTDG
ncbi:MAG TPA: lysylphosphatidylglycerol synthase transmembrane domain-containing protein [Solirubrobacteraceae bacterium]|nr:lysylphosphatidylglycerol synthase transmembrane domain-containing protein [Solirubrobacteraceae bacterium]